MGYLHDIDAWLDELLPMLDDAANVKHEIKEKILESYHNGLKASQKPVQRQERSPREDFRRPRRR